MSHLSWLYLLNRMTSPHFFDNPRYNQHCLNPGKKSPSYSVQQTNLSRAHLSTRFLFELSLTHDHFVDVEVISYNFRNRLRWRLQPLQKFGSCSMIKLFSIAWVLWPLYANRNPVKRAIQEPESPKIHRPAVVFVDEPDVLYALQLKKKDCR